MAPDRIAVIDRSARRALQMCDIVLSETISTKAFVTIFKEPKYLSAISGIFDGVRDLLIKILRRVSLIEDSSACLETFMVITEVTALPRKERLVASVNSLAHKLALYPLFFTTDGAEDVAALHDVQYNDPGDPDKTRARALIHELVHYVSYHRYYHFRDQISSPGAPHFLDNVTDRMANDIQPIDFALDSSDEDWNFVGWFGGSVAYGRLRVERLAQLHHGARASLLNADSYAIFAVDCMERYFRRQKGMARKLEQLRRQRHLMMTKAWDMSSLMEASTLIEASMPTRAEAATPTSPRSSELTPQTASTSTTTQKSRTPTTPGKRKVIYRLRITRSQARNAKEAGMHPRSKVWIGRLRKRMVNPT